MNRDSTTILGSCSISDIRLDRKKIDAIHLVMRFDTATNELSIRDNRTESGTFQVNTNSALDQGTLYKFPLEAGRPIRLKTGKDVDIEIAYHQQEPPPLLPSIVYSNHVEG